MKTLTTKEKQSVPAVRMAHPYVHHPIGPVQQARQAEIRRILHSTGAQAKLTIGQPNDKYEQEADRIADEVMRMPDPKLQRQPEDEEGQEMLQTKPLADQITPLVQRQEEPPEEEQKELVQVKPFIQRQTEEEEEKEEEVLQGTFTNNETSTQLQGDLGEVENCNSIIPRPLKTGLEVLSGMDLSGVRVHNNSSKPAQLKASAYTQGQDIHVASGQEKHLPHEGWHAVQQMQGRVKPTMQAKGVSINDDAGLEREADVMGAKALQMKWEEEVTGSSNTTAVQSTMVQRVADKSNVPTGMACTVDTASGRPTGTDILFNRSERTLDTLDRALIAIDYVKWVARGGRDKIIVDGFASSDGGPRYNWRLSCNRAEAVKAEFVLRFGVPAVLVTTIAHGETEEFSTTSYPPNRVAVIHTVSGPTPPPGPTFPLLLGRNRANCGAGPDFATGPPGYPASAPIPEIVLRTLAGFPTTPRAAISNADLEDVFANSVPDGLVFLAGAEGRAAIARFMAGTGTTHRFAPTSFMGARAAASTQFATALAATKTLLEADLTIQAATGPVDISRVRLARPPRPTWPKSAILSEPQLVSIIGGTQGVEIWANAFSHNPVLRTYTIDLTFIVCDDFGLSAADLYSPALFAFWVLQYERAGPAPYVHELEINTTTSSSY
jgi:outer membrane protein OmpA-like peptidoglycan-associated protein